MFCINKYIITQVYNKHGYLFYTHNNLLLGTKEVARLIYEIHIVFSCSLEQAIEVFKESFKSYHLSPIITPTYIKIYRIMWSGLYSI